MKEEEERHRKGVGVEEGEEGGNAQAATRLNGAQKAIHTLRNISDEFNTSVDGADATLFSSASPSAELSSWLVLARVAGSGGIVLSAAPLVGVRDCDSVGSSMSSCVVSSSASVSARSEAVCEDNWEAVCEVDCEAAWMVDWEAAWMVDWEAACKGMRDCTPESRLALRARGAMAGRESDRRAGDLRSDATASAWEAGWVVGDR